MLGNSNKIRARRWEGHCVLRYISFYSDKIVFSFFNVCECTDVSLNPPIGWICASDVPSKSLMPSIASIDTIFFYPSTSNWFTLASPEFKEAFVVFVMSRSITIHTTQLTPIKVVILPVECHSPINNLTAIAINRQTFVYVCVCVFTIVFIGPDPFRRPFNVTIWSKRW